MIDKLNVTLWGKHVGVLTNYNRALTCFYFDEDFIRNGWDLSPLRFALNSPRAQRGLPFIGEEGKIFSGLPSFIADSLPDHWGQKVFREWACRHSIRMKDVSALDFLAYIGRRSMGALEFEPCSSEDMSQPFKVEIEELSRFAHWAMSQAEALSTSLDLVTESLFRVGTSAGGKRPKAVINVNLETEECYSGQVPTPFEGYTPMIIKFDEHSDVPTTRIEYSYYLMAKAAGMNMMRSLLLTKGGSSHFLTERFDRTGDEKIHVQTLAALNPLAECYEDLFLTANSLAVPIKEKQELYRQMCMNIICGNVDDHTKNFSFTMNKEGQWHAAPAYDFTFCIDPDALPVMNRHSISLNGKTEDIKREDLLSVAKKFDIKSAGTIIEQCLSTALDYERYGEEAQVSTKWIATILAEIRRFE